MEVKENHGTMRDVVEEFLEMVEEDDIENVVLVGYSNKNSKRHMAIFMPVQDEDNHENSIIALTEASIVLRKYEQAKKKPN